VNTNATSHSEHLVVGPVLTRQGGFAFDCWTPGDGLRNSYVYRHIEGLRNPMPQQALWW
jgi:hypothetical protein